MLLAKDIFDAVETLERHNRTSRDYYERVVSMPMKNLKDHKTTGPIDTRGGKEGYCCEGEMSDDCMEEMDEQFPRADECGSQHEEPIEWPEVQAKTPFRVK